VDVLLYYICVLGSALLAIMCEPAVDGLLYYPLVLKRTQQSKLGVHHSKKKAV